MISVVVTAYNDAPIIPELTRRLKLVLEKLDASFEILFVDDGSIDDTLLRLEREHASDSRVKYLQFSRNFGQPFALRAGIAHATGDRVVIMDGDLQDLPEEIPKLLAPLSHGSDLVYAKRTHRQDTWFRQLSSRLIIKMLASFIRDESWQKGEEAMLVGVFRAMNKDVAEALRDLPEHTAYIQALIRWVGFRQMIIDVEHGKRFAGESKYSFGKLIRYALDGVISFSPYPLRIVSFIGFSLAALSFVAGVGYFFQRILYGTQLLGFTTIILVMLFLGGMQLFIMGVLGEYIGRMYGEIKNRPLYIIKKKVL
jgi:polyisoprenyl-phosphate glycosyltransferase